MEEETTIIEEVPISQKSILEDIKKMLGVVDNNFDTDIIIHINSTFMILNQLGIGPLDGFSISDSNKKWIDYIPDKTNLDGIKTYIYLKVKLIFDPPINSTVIESINKTITELEWRLNLNVE